MAGQPRFCNKIDISWKALIGQTEAHAHTNRFLDCSECGKHTEDDSSNLISPPLCWALMGSFHGPRSSVSHSRL